MLESKSPSYKNLFCCGKEQDCLILGANMGEEPCWGQVEQSILDDGFSYLGNPVHLCQGHLKLFDGESAKAYIFEN